MDTIFPITPSPPTPKSRRCPSSAEAVTLSVDVNLRTCWAPFERLDAPEAREDTEEDGVAVRSPWLLFAQLDLSAT